MWSSRYGRKIWNARYGILTINSKGIKNNFYGRKHKPEMIKIMSDKKSGTNNPMYGKIGINSPTFGRKRPKEEVERMLKTRAKNKKIKQVA